MKIFGTGPKMLQIPSALEQIFLLESIYIALSVSGLGAFAIRARNICTSLGHGRTRIDYTRCVYNSNNNFFIRLITFDNTIWSASPKLG
jgi:hypothetical protein